MDDEDLFAGMATLSFAHRGVETAQVDRSRPLPFGSEPVVSWLLAM
jgi:hypothetical protein